VAAVDIILTWVLLIFQDHWIDKKGIFLSMDFKLVEDWPQLKEFFLFLDIFEHHKIVDEGELYRPNWQSLFCYILTCSFMSQLSRHAKAAKQ